MAENSAVGAGGMPTVDLDSMSATDRMELVHQALDHMTVDEITALIDTAQRKRPNEAARAMRHADPNFLGNYLAGLPRLEHPAHGAAETIREDEYKGHHVVIKTTYEITVDGAPLDVHVGLSNDGSVHTHGLPNYQFASVVDMVRVLIDYFPDEFPPGGPTGGQYGGHGQHRGHHPGES